MQASDQIRIVEAAYALDLADDDWQYQLTRFVAEQWGSDVGSTEFDASDPTNIIRKRPMVAGSAKSRATFEAAMSVVPPDPALMAAIYRTTPAVTNIYELFGPQPEESDDFKMLLDAAPELELSAFSHGIRTVDPSHRGLMFATAARPVDDRLRETWTQLATHIGIGYRLRRARNEASAELIGEAVVDLDGRCQHAEGGARSAEAREALREGARRVMRARSSLRRRDPDQALEIWQGLISGRWSLVDRFDSDGKHYLVAHRNPPEVCDPRALTEREAQVAAYLGMGLSNKLIGYALGLSGSTVADHIASIGRKLKVRSRLDLIQLLAAFHAPADEPT